MIRVCVQVLRALKEKYGGLYRRDNVVLSGTHTHCGPAGYFQYTLFMITSNGYIKAAVEPLVNGIVKVCLWSTEFSFSVLSLITSCDDDDGDTGPSDQHQVTDLV